MTASAPPFTDIVFKRQDAQYDLLHLDASGQELLMCTCATLGEVYEEIYHQPRAGQVGYRDWRTPSLTEPFR